MSELNGSLGTYEFGQVRTEIQAAASPKEPGLVRNPQEGSSLETNDFPLWFK